jgi:hypothetical protein
MAGVDADDIEARLGECVLDHKPNNWIVFDNEHFPT